ncbi:VQ motif-containing protein 11-like [Hibiscus syriacus]|uniref:VQ motif-containing protein 11-like n=1 Tax=Hibiscus syriacus TaxID=106335 RepID=UPI00192118FE|nr:VQ motif-containing protein 11-like [Hibiscus syriacus]
MASSSKTTTFVQADPSTFRTIVQLLTGAEKPISSLHERRRALDKLQINRNTNGKNDSPCAGQRGSSVSSPISTLDFVPLLSPPPSNAKRTRSTVVEEEEGEKRGLYLHNQSGPLNTRRRGAEPELLHLFPLHSPSENIH